MPGGAGDEESGGLVNQSPDVDLEKVLKNKHEEHEIKKVDDAVEKATDIALIEVNGKNYIRNNIC